MAWPWIFFVLTLMVIVGQGLPQVILVLGIRTGVVYSRVVRSAVIGIKENLYVVAAKVIGAPTRRILIRHVLPNIMGPLIIIFTISVGDMIIDEATVSFLGFGIPPPIPSWGGMLSLEGRKFMIWAPWLAVWPGLALSLAVYGINVLGDAIRDILDPRLRGGLGSYGRVKLKKNKE
jgi:peptide/nickel transport system permease protein